MAALETILIVDDEPSVLQLFQKFLSRKGYNCLLASNALEAMRLVRKERIDLVLTDYQMPQINGMELLREIRAFNGNLPIIMMSGAGDMQLALQALKEHAFDFLNKPVDSAELLSVVRQALDRPEPAEKIAQDFGKEFGPLYLGQPDEAEGLQTVYFNRPLDEYSIKAFSQALQHIQPELKSRFLLVLRNVTYINSVGLNFLLDILQRFKQEKRRFALVQISDPVYRYLKMLGYLDYLPVAANLSAGAALLR